MLCAGVSKGLCIAEPEIVTRDEWGARPPTAVENMTNPVPFVVIHHSYIPAACETKEDCIEAMQWMQDYHQVMYKNKNFNHNMSLFKVQPILERHRIQLRSWG